jgi:pyruvate dehydrogenase (quinone)
MNGNGELVTIAKYWQRWGDPRLIVLVLHNNDLNQVTWEQRVMSGDPKLDASQVLPDFDYAGFARLLGLHGVTVTRPEDVGAAWDDALAAGKPALVEFVTDPEVPPLPPHIRFEQARELAHTLVQGDPAAPRFIRQSLRGKLAELLTR